MIPPTASQLQAQHTNPGSQDPEFSLLLLPCMAPLQQTGAIIITTTTASTDEDVIYLFKLCRADNIDEAPTVFRTQLLIYLWRQDIQNLLTTYHMCKGRRGGREEGERKKNLNSRLL